MTNTLYVQVFSQQAWDPTVVAELNVLNYVTVKEYAVQSTLFIFQYGGSNNPSATPYPIYVDDDTAVAASSAAAASILVTMVNANYGNTYYTAYDVEKVSPPLVPALAGKVDKIVGKGLSTNDYTTPEQTKLAGIAAGATVYTDTNAKAAALAASLSGLSTATNSAITSSDTVISALGKLQAQVSSFSNAQTFSIITPSLVGTGATGTQVSATKNSMIILNLNESVTSSIGGPSIAAINVKICATNNATEASWTTLFTFEEDQTITLAVALNSVQVMKGCGVFAVPAGYYWKAESSGSGTNSESIITGQQIIYG